MKAVFKGYKKAGCFEFTVGKIYELSTTPGSCGYTEVTDDNNFRGTFIPGDIYDFEVLIPDEPITSSKLFDDSYGCEMMMNEILSKPQIEQKQFTFYINGDAVTKRRFDEVLSCVKDFEAEGVDASSIKFELKFE